jgi:hypothetical protein
LIRSDLPELNPCNRRTRVALNVWSADAFCYN